MFDRIYSFFKSQKYFFALSVFFALHLLISALNYLTSNQILGLFHSIIGFFFVIFGTGINIVIIWQWLSKKIFDRWEFISLSLLGGLLIAPALLTIEFFIFRKAYNWYPAMNYVIFWLGVGILLYFKKTTFPKLTFSAKKITKHPLFIALILGFIFTLVQIFLYPTLPDLDPYKWLFKYSYQFANQQLDYAERPFFGSLIFIGTQLMGLSVLSFFKYVIPFLYLIVFFPAWLVAKTFQNTTKQLLFLLFALTSPVAILYAQTAMPQSILIILTYFFVYFLLYSYLEKDDFFLYLSGLISFLSFFFHQGGVIIFMAWIILVLIDKRGVFLKDKKMSVFLIIILLSNLSKIRPLYSFAKNWIDIIIARFQLPDKLNLFYPAYYSNIDHKAMGWSSFDGVVKFYAFHTGPIVGLILISCIILFFKKSFRSFLAKKLFSSISMKISAFSFFLFFVIAEILPRFPNLALLPDRAWIFASIFSIVFLFILLSYVEKIPKWFTAIFLIFFCLNLAGATYVNYLKKYLITPTQLQSSEWIKNNLPENKVFLSFGNKGLLPVYANASLIKIPAEMYCEKTLDNFQSIIQIKDTPVKDSTLVLYESFLNNAKQKIDIASSFHYNSLNDKQKKLSGALEATRILLGDVAQIKDLLAEKNRGLPIIYSLSQIPKLSSPLRVEDIYEFEKFELLNHTDNNFFIYYSRQHKLNPYRERPYNMTTWGINPCPNGKFLFDQYSDKFKRVYSANDEEVIIWKIL